MPCLNDASTSSSSNANHPTGDNQLFLPMVRNRIKYFHDQQFFLDEIDQRITAIKSELLLLEQRKHENIKKRKRALESPTPTDVESSTSSSKRKRVTKTAPDRKNSSKKRKRNDEIVDETELPASKRALPLSSSLPSLPTPPQKNYEHEWIELTRKISKLHDELKLCQSESTKVSSHENELIWTQRMLPLLHDFYSLDEEPAGVSASGGGGGALQTRESILNEYIDRCERDFMTNEQQLSRTQKQNKQPIKQKRRKQQVLQNTNNTNYDEIPLHESLVTSHQQHQQNRVRNRLVRSYWCRRCHRETLVTVDSESILVCVRCARVVRDLATNDRGFNYNEAPDKIANMYQRRTHFRDKLNSIQGRQQRKIPPEFEEKIKTQLRIGRINFKDVTRVHIRRAIKSLGREYKDWYEYDTMIACKISGRPCLRFSAAQEAILYRDFEAIQRPYDECPSKYQLDKDNFMNYNFVIFKIVQRHGWTEFLEDITLLKSPSKLAELQTIWKYICNRLGWTVIESCSVRPKPNLMQLKSLKDQYMQSHQQQQSQSHQLQPYQLIHETKVYQYSNREIAVY